MGALPAKNVPPALGASSARKLVGVRHLQEVVFGGGLPNELSSSLQLSLLVEGALRLTLPQQGRSDVRSASGRPLQVAGSWFGPRLRRLALLANGGTPPSLPSRSGADDASENSNFLKIARYGGIIPVQDLSRLAVEARRDGVRPRVLVRPLHSPPAPHGGPWPALTPQLAVPLPMAQTQRPHPVLPRLQSRRPLRRRRCLKGQSRPPLRRRARRRPPLVTPLPPPPSRPQGPNGRARAAAGRAAAAGDEFVRPQRGGGGCGR